MVNAIGDYGRVGAAGHAGAFERLEQWGIRLAELVANADMGRDLLIRLEETKAIANAINYYGEAGVVGQAGAFERLEQWGSRLAGLAAGAGLSHDPEIRQLEAMIARVTIQHYRNAGMRGLAVEREWRKRLAHVAQRFPWNLEIAEHAKNMGLSVRDQERSGWPHGRVEPYPRPPKPTPPPPEPPSRGKRRRMIWPPSGV